MKNIFKTKKAFMALFGTGFVVVSSTIISVAVVLAPKNNDYYHYEFDGRAFNTKEELDEYIKNNVSYNSVDTANDFYLYNSTPYAVDSMYEIVKDIEQKNQIIEQKTYKNINKNIIDTSNQLSDNVITNSNEKLINVYKGQDSMAYLNKDEAIESYKNIEKQYIINNLNDEKAQIEFSNKNDAVAYYENIVRKQIESGTQTNKYNVSGLDI